MFGTIFRRQFITYIGNLIIIFIILGAAMSGMFRSYFYGQKQETLETQCKRISDGYIDTYVRGRTFFVENPAFMTEIGSLYKYLGASCFVCTIDGIPDEHGRYTDADLSLYVWTVRAWEDTELVNKAINDVPEFKKTHYGEIVMVTGTMSGIFDERMMIVGYPIIYKDNIYGVVFMNSPISEIEVTIREVVTLTLLCLLASALIAFILIYFSSKTISRPIHQINEVAKIIAAGRFDRRLKVKSRDEVGQLSESFNFMAESLENQEMSRRAFISNISHDLRTPLTSMKGFMQAMLDGTIPPEKYHKYLQIVLDETERITKMANDLTFIGKIQNFDLELDKKNFDINELVRTTLIKFEQRIYDKDLNISVSFADEKSIVEADYEKIQRVIYNLIDNAIKYTGVKGSILLKTSAEQRCPGKIFVSIKDDGVGIAPNEQKKIFDRFYKSDHSRGQDKTGSGLGLAIVKEFIQAHNESLRLISALGAGSEFSFSLTLIH